MYDFCYHFLTLLVDSNRCFSERYNYCVDLGVFKGKVSTLGTNHPYIQNEHFQAVLTQNIFSEQYCVCSSYVLKCITK